jgi:hypothetical protein
LVLAGVIVGVAVLAGALPAAAPATSQPTSQTKPSADQGKTDPPDLPLKLELVAKKTTYAIPPGQAGKDFAKSLQPAMPLKQPPPPPAVEMTLELTNTGAKAVTVNVGGDNTSIELKLEGPGAVTVPYKPMHTMEFRMGVPTKIEPGKSITMPIARLQYGQRGDSTASYWTEPGTYTLTASYVTEVPGMAPAKEDRVTITAAPVKIEVTAPEEKAK